MNLWYLLTKAGLILISAPLNVYCKNIKTVVIVFIKSPPRPTISIMFTIFELSIRELILKSNPLAYLMMLTFPKKFNVVTYTSYHWIFYSFYHNSQTNKMKSNKNVTWLFHCYFVCYCSINLSIMLPGGKNGHMEWRRMWQRAKVWQYDCIPE